MGRYKRRNPSGYNGCKRTTHRLEEVLPSVLMQVSKAYGEDGLVVMNEWPSIIGERLAPMAQAVSFSEGILVVTVKNTTLYSLLRSTEHPVLLRKLRERFPNTTIRNIVFRIG